MQKFKDERPAEAFESTKLSIVTPLDILERVLTTVFIAKPFINYIHM
jgi:hypothetical protein